jgi:hypothetical protein
MTVLVVNTTNAHIEQIYIKHPPHAHHMPHKLKKWNIEKERREAIDNY